MSRTPMVIGGRIVVADRTRLEALSGDPVIGFALPALAGGIRSLAGRFFGRKAVTAAAGQAVRGLPQALQRFTTGLPALGGAGGAILRRAGRFFPGVAGVAGGALGAEALIRAVSGEPKKKRRRMNVANIRALRRSVRRVSGFERIARRTIQLTKRVKLKKRRRAA